MRAVGTRDVRRHEEKAAPARRRSRSRGQRLTCGRSRRTSGRVDRAHAPLRRRRPGACPAAGAPPSSLSRSRRACPRRRRRASAGSRRSPMAGSAPRATRSPTSAVGRASSRTSPPSRASAWRSAPRGARCRRPRAPAAVASPRSRPAPGRPHRYACSRARASAAAALDRVPARILGHGEHASQRLLDGCRRRLLARVQELPAARDGVAERPPATSTAIAGHRPSHRNGYGGRPATCWPLVGVDRAASGSPARSATQARFARPIATYWSMPRRRLVSMSRPRGRAPPPRGPPCGGRSTDT